MFPCNSSNGNSSGAKTSDVSAAASVPAHLSRKPFAVVHLERSSLRFQYSRNQTVDSSDTLTEPVP